MRRAELSSCTESAIFHHNKPRGTPIPCLLALRICVKPHTKNKRIVNKTGPLIIARGVTPTQDQPLNMSTLVEVVRQPPEAFSVSGASEDRAHEDLNGSLPLLDGLSVLAREDIRQSELLNQVSL